MVKVVCCGGCCPPEEDLTKSSLLKPGPRSDGAEKQRGCTDCLCLLLLALALVPAGIIAAAAFSVGDVRRLTNGEDYAGALCGVGDLETKPFVYYPRLALDLRRYQSMVSTAPWAIPLYGLCVAACPSQGDSVTDYPCDDGSDRCRWRPTAPDAPPWAREQPNEWRVSMDTMAVASRCVPISRASEDAVQLCAYPDCVAAGQPCYTEAFAAEHYWLVGSAPRALQEAEAAVPEAAAPAAVPEAAPVPAPTAAPAPVPAPAPAAAPLPTTLQCLEFVTLDTTRVRASRGAELELEFMGNLFGGALGVATDVYLGSFEIVICGVVVALVANGERSSSSTATMSSCPGDLSSCAEI